MRKIAIVIACVLWLIAGISFLARQQERKQEDVVSAFGGNNFYEINTKLEGFGKCTADLSDPADKEQMVKYVATKLGLRDYEYSMKMDNNIITTEITKSGKNADVVIKQISYDESSQSSSEYLFVDLLLKNNIESAMTYKAILEEIYKDLKIEPEVTVIMEGKVNGYLDYAAKNVLTDSFMRKIDAGIVSENRNMDLFVVYGYTKQIKDYINVSGEKINVTVSIEYDENNDTTSVYMATPINSMN